MYNFDRIERGMVFFIEDIPGIRKPFVVLTSNSYADGKASLVCPIITADFCASDGVVNFAGTNNKNLVIDLNNIRSVSRSTFTGEYFSEPISRKLMSNKSALDDIQSELCKIFSITPISFFTGTNNGSPIQVIVNVPDYINKSETMIKPTEKADNCEIEEICESDEMPISDDSVSDDADDTNSIPDDADKKVSKKDNKKSKRVYGKRMPHEVMKKFLKDYSSNSSNYMLKKYAEYGIDSVAKLHNRVSKARQALRRLRRGERV